LIKISDLDAVGLTEPNLRVLHITQMSGLLSRLGHGDKLLYVSWWQWRGQDDTWGGESTEQVS